MNKPLVSIIISTHHDENLFASIDSVLRQDYSPLELLVAYGGYADETVEGLVGRQKHDKRLNCFLLPGKDAATLANQAVRHVRGTIIGCLNPGDTYDAGAIERGVKAFAATPDGLMVYGDGNMREAAKIALPALFFKFSLMVLLGAWSVQNVSPFEKDFWRMALIRYANRMVDIDALPGRSTTDGNVPGEGERALLADERQDNCWVPLWAERVFSQSISLGSFCHAAKVLRDIEYRAFAGPFDWIFSSPKIVTHMLQDDFDLFLDVSHYQPVPVEQRINVEANLCDHRFYRDHLGMRFLFNHHSPDNAKDHDYFTRAVQRFRAAMATSPPPLLLMVTNQDVQLDDYWPLLEALDRYGSDYALLLLRFMVDETGAMSGEKSKPRLLFQDRRFAALEMRFSASSNGVEFANAEDNQALLQVLRRFNVRRHPRGSSQEKMTVDKFDEAGYLTRNPDVAAAINAGRFSSGWQHFQLHGFKEGRH